MPDPHDTLQQAGNGAFPSTHWTLIRGVQSGSEDERRRALEELCRTYWYPIYVFTRRRGLEVEEAKDAVQDFFVRVLQRNTFAAADREKGRLRTWLLAQLTGCLTDRARHRGRLKRGGDAPPVSFDALAAEDRYRHEPADHDTPESAFERTCARVLADEVLAGLRAEFEARSQGARFETLTVFAFSECDTAQRAAACGQLGMKDGAFRTAVHRFREALASRLRRRLETLVESPADLDAEAAAIIAALSR